MVNRVLIRIKVVQLLYSYLLSQNEFRIESQVENPSRDKKYAYSLYLDLLLLVLELSGIDVSNGQRTSPLSTLSTNQTLTKGQLAKALNSNFELREIITRGLAHPEQFDSIVPSVYKAIEELPAYKAFAKSKTPDIHDELSLWISIVENLMGRNENFIETARRNENFTMAGFERAIEMVKSTLSDYGNNRALLIQSRNALDHSLKKAHELYFYLLMLAPEITRAQEGRLDDARNKFMPTDAELYPDMRFVENKYVSRLCSLPEYEEYISKNKLSWNDDLTVDNLLDAILVSKEYKYYMSAPGEKTLAEDAALWRDLYNSVILQSDALIEALENQSVYWNDDLHEMGSFVTKTIRRIGYSDEPRDGSRPLILPMYKDEEDSRMGAQIFDDAVKNYQNYRAIIEKFVDSARWDADRLAFMDVVILVAAIAELHLFPNIPLAVTFNEYIEIANYYSSPRSGSFINGILYSVTKYLNEQGVIIKKVPVPVDKN